MFVVKKKFLVKWILRMGKCMMMVRTFLYVFQVLGGLQLQTLLTYLSTTGCTTCIPSSNGWVSFAQYFCQHLHSQPFLLLLFKCSGSHCSLIWISLMIRDGIFSCAYLLFIYLIWWSVCSNLFAWFFIASAFSPLNYWMLTAYQIYALIRNTYIEYDLPFPCLNSVFTNSVLNFG